MLNFLKRFGFVYGLFGTIALAWWLPDWGAPDGWLQSPVTTKLGIFIIFMMQGLLLPIEELKRGFANWRLHAFTQGTIFIGVPLLASLILMPFREQLGNDLWLGFMFLAILPCTISTSVVFVTQSGGNVAGALFNTSLANVAGIFIVPTFCVWLTEVKGEAMPLLPLIGKVVLLLLVPLIIGQTMRALLPMARRWAGLNRKLIGRANTGIILFLVYCAFCGSFQSRFWEGQESSAMWLTFGLVCALFMLLWLVLFLVLRILPLSYGDATVAFFCGSQKTLAAGVPMAQGIFAISNFDLGLILLPLMFYVPLQFTFGGILVSILQKRAAEANFSTSR